MRTVPEWIGKTDNSMPPESCFRRLWAKQDGKSAISGVPFRPGDKVVRDHIVPLIDGGRNCESNLQLITEKEHRLKTGREAVQRTKERDVQRVHRGYVRTRPFPKLRSRGFDKRPPQRNASRPLTKRQRQEREETI